MLVQGRKVETAWCLRRGRCWCSLESFRSWRNPVAVVELALCTGALSRWNGSSEGIKATEAFRMNDTAQSLLKGGQASTYFWPCSASGIAFGMFISESVKDEQ